MSNDPTPGDTYNLDPNGFVALAGTQVKLVAALQEQALKYAAVPERERDCIPSLQIATDKLMTLNALVNQ